MGLINRSVWGGGWGRITCIPLIYQLTELREGRRLLLEIINGLARGAGLPRHEAIRGERGAWPRRLCGRAVMSSGGGSGGGMRLMSWSGPRARPPPHRLATVLCRGAERTGIFLCRGDNRGSSHTPAPWGQGGSIAGASPVGARDGTSLTASHLSPPVPSARHGGGDQPIP